jgi:hypothetical protein
VEPYGTVALPLSVHFRMAGVNYLYNMATSLKSTHGLYMMPVSKKNKISGGNYKLINVKITRFKVSVKDDSYDACKTANIKMSGLKNLDKWALTCYGGFTHRVFVKRIKSAIHVSVLSVSICTATVHRRKGHHIEHIF